MLCGTKETGYLMQEQGKRLLALCWGSVCWPHSHTQCCFLNKWLSHSALVERLMLLKCLYLKNEGFSDWHISVLWNESVAMDKRGNNPNQTMIPLSPWDDENPIVRKSCRSVNLLKQEPLHAEFSLPQLLRRGFPWLCLKRKHEPNLWYCLYSLRLSQTSWIWWTSPTVVT